MKIQWISLATAVGISLSTSLHASETLEPQQVRELVKQGRLLPLAQIRALHPELQMQQVLDVELEREEDGYRYEIETLGPDGKVMEYEIDAVSGELLEREIEDD